MASQNDTANNFNQVIDKTVNSPTYDQTTIIDNSSHDDNSILLDLSGSTLNLITENGDRVTQNIESVIYDSSDHSYNVTTYDTTYNTENNYYEYNYYTYNIQYTYNNTYITYIGSTAEYQPKEWELYYELPDGRSSADLTEEDVAGLSFQFADCINYKKSATDTRLRALYHFDGNVNDVSYFSDKTAFTWNKGASITYMDANAFNGCLYLDEKEHQFTVTLPSNIGGGDFTLQWRYYQTNAAQNDHNENYVSIGGQKVLGWSEQYFYSQATTKLSTGISIGTWQELALVRNKGTLYIYHNGVRIGSFAFGNTLSNQIVFYLGSNSRGYSMLDEMRFVKGALYTAGEAYTPTAVPYDTNQVLVLPDSPTPVSDAYWQFDTTITPKFKFNFTDSSVRSNLYSVPAYNSSTSITGFGYPSIFYPSGGASMWGDGFFHVEKSSLCSTSGAALLSYDSSFGIQRGYNNVSLYLYGNYYESDYDNCYPDCPLFTNDYGQIVSGRQVTVCAVFSNGSMAFDTVSLVSSAKNNAWNLSNETNTLTATLSLYKYSHNFSDGGSTLSYSWLLELTGDCDLVYLEIVQGTQGNTNHQYITATYDAEDIQPNTAAIQTDIPINGYTVGGVRPTFPVRGDVWFPVEGSRITGVQIYNGQAWVETNARWWTGSRWIPIYAFDLITLADMWDISSAEGSDVEVTPPITSESGFWNWWKKSWNDFTNRLFGVLQPGSGPGGSGSGSGSDDPGSGEGRGFIEKILDALADGIATLVKGLFDVITEIFKMLLSVVTDMLSAIFSFVTDTVLGGIKSFFSFFTDGTLFEFFQPDPESGAEGVALPEGIVTVFSVFSGIIMLLPWELRSLLIFGIAAAVLIAVFKFAKA